MNTDYIKQGDCVDLMGELPANSIDLVVTSPPYDSLRTYNGFCFDFERVAQELFRIIKPGGVVVWIVADGTEKGSETGSSFRQALYFKEIGFNIHDTMIWRKDTSAFPEKIRYSQVFEYMFIFSKGRPKTVNLIKDRKNKWSGTKIHGTFRQADGVTRERSKTWKEIECKDYGARFNVWDIPTEKNNKTGHPAVFPLNLAKDHIKTWSNPGDIILDCFMGSGTVAVAAIETDRHYIGFDISEKYCEIARNRTEGHTWQMEIRP